MSPFDFVTTTLIFFNLARNLVKSSVASPRGTGLIESQPSQNAPPGGRVSRDIAFDKTRAIATARARIVSGSSAEPDNRHPRRGKGTTRDFCNRRARAWLCNPS